MLKLFSCQEFSFTTLSQLLALPLTLISIWLISWTFNTELPLITIMVMCLDNVKLTSTLTILSFLLHRFVWRWNFVHLNIQVMCLDIHPDYPNMIAIGLYDGNVAVSDYQMCGTSRKVMPIFLGAIANTSDIFKGVQLEVVRDAILYFKYLILAHICL